MTNPIKQAAFNVQQHKQTQLSNLIDSIHGELAQAEESQIRKFPEKIFINTFLPFFAREVPETQQVSGQSWIEVAGHAFLPVDIVDDNGVTLYRVPPLFERNAVQQKDINAEQGDISHVLATTTMLASSHPMRGQNYFEREMNERLPLEGQHPTVVSNREGWNAIFRRYGKALIGQDPATATNIPQQDSPAAKAEDVNYDDSSLI